MNPSALPHRVVKCCPVIRRLLPYQLRGGDFRRDPTWSYGGDLAEKPPTDSLTVRVPIPRIVGFGWDQPSESNDGAG
jgi:hypothetical protein